MRNFKRKTSELWTRKCGTLDAKHRNFECRNMGRQGGGYGGNRQEARKRWEGNGRIGTYWCGYRLNLSPRLYLKRGGEAGDMNGGGTGKARRKDGTFWEDGRHLPQNFPCMYAKMPDFSSLFPRFTITLQRIKNVSRCHDSPPFPPQSACFPPCC